MSGGFEDVVGEASAVGLGEYVIPVIPVYVYKKTARRPSNTLGAAPFVLLVNSASLFAQHVVQIDASPVSGQIVVELGC